MRSVNIDCRLTLQNVIKNVATPIQQEENFQRLARFLTRTKNVLKVHLKQKELSLHQLTMRYFKKSAAFWDDKTELQAVCNSLIFTETLQYCDGKLMAQGSGDEKDTIVNKTFTFVSMPRRNKTRDQISYKSGPSEEPKDSRQNSGAFIYLRRRFQSLSYSATDNHCDKSFHSLRKK